MCCGPFAVDQPEVADEDAHATRQVDEEHPPPARPFGSTPPRNTPAAEARPAIAPQAPSALVRSVPSLNVVVRIDSAAGSIIAAPSPCTSRAPTSIPSSVPAKPAPSDESAKSDGAGDQHAPATEQVGGAAAEQHEPAVGEQVAAEHPLQVLDREVQVGADRRQRDVDDRRVDEVEERRPRTATASVSLPRRVARKDGAAGAVGSWETSD